MDHRGKKVKNSLNTMYLIISVISSIECYCVFYCSTVKEIWDTFKIIYNGSSEIKKEWINTLNQESEISKSSKENIQDLLSNNI